MLYFQQAMIRHSVFAAQNEGTMCWGDRRSRDRIQLEAAKDDTQDSHNLLALDEAKALKNKLENIALPTYKRLSCAYNHKRAQEDKNYSEKSARSNLADEDGRRWLEKSIWADEYKRDDGKSIILVIHMELVLRSRRLSVAA
jgi:hypothetical protein